MQITCKVDQKESIKRGINCHSTVKIEVDVSTLNDAQRGMLAEYFFSGEFRTESGYTWPEIPQPDAAGLAEKLDKMITCRAEESAKKAAEKAENDRKTAEYNATPIEDLIEWKLSGSDDMLTPSGAVCNGYRYKEYLTPPTGTKVATLKYQHGGKEAKYKEALAVAAAHNLAIYEPLMAAKKAKELEEKAVKEAAEAEEKIKADAVAAEQKEARRYAVNKYGSETQKAMFRDDVLGKNTVEKWLEDEAFAPLSDWSVYEPLTDDDCDFGDLERDEVKTYHRHTNLSVLTEDQFRRKEEAKKLIPGCGAVVMSHVIEDDDVSDIEFTPTQTALKVTVKHRGYKFTREFAL